MNTASLWRWYANSVLVMALLVELPRFTVVNWRIEGITDNAGVVIGLLTGIGMGYVMSGGTAIVFHAWREERRKGSKSERLLLAFFLGFLVAEGVMLTPYVNAGIGEVAIKNVLDQADWLRWLWSIVTAVAPLAVVAGVAFSLDGLPHSKAIQPRSFTRTPERMTNERLNARKDYSPVYTLIQDDPNISIKRLSEATGLSVAGIHGELKTNGWHKNGNGWERGE